jgi:hypothetical protein
MKKIRLHLGVFITLLVLSGVTAFPVLREIDFLYENRAMFLPVMKQWIVDLYVLLHKTSPVVLYGTDWLAFAHIIIALFFIPLLIDPARYGLNLRAGMLACLLIFPLAFICGHIRNIPCFHQLIDCSFGAIGFLYLFFIDRLIKKLPV